MDYPDLTKPMKAEKGSSQNSYPDLSEPISDSSKRINLFPKPMGEEKEKSYRQEQRKNLTDLTIGGAQGFGNIPGDTVNLINPTSHKVPRFNFAPNNEMSNIGQAIAPFVGPQGLEIGALKALSFIPNALNKVKALTSAAKSRPITNALMRSGKTAGEIGYINALAHPEDSKMEFLKGAAMGAPLGVLGPIAAKGGKYAAPLAKGAIGALIGGQFGHPFAGAATAIGLPIRALFGMESQNKVARDMLSGLSAKDVAKSINANRRLGTNVTPGEASGNYVRSGQEGALKRTAGGGQLGYRLEEAEKHKQGNAINRMLDKIYKPTKQKENEINSLYEKAYEEHVDPIVINAMMQNPVMKQAIESVQMNPAYAEIPTNSYEFLHQVDRTLERQIKGLDRTDPNSAFVYRGYKNMFNKFLKDQNNNYKLAQEASQPKIVRRNIEEKLNKQEEDLTAKNFYSKLLNSRKSYQSLLNDTKNFPEAQSMIKDMRAGWKNLANMKTTSQGEAQAKSAIDQARQMANYMMTMVKNIAGGKSDISRLKFIYSPEWEKSFASLDKIKDKEKRISEMTNKIVNSAVKAGLSVNQANNLVGIMKDDDKK